MSEETQKLLERLRQRLHTAARRIVAAQLAYRTLISIGIVTLTLLVITGLEALFWMPVTWRSLLFWALLAVAAGLFVVLMAAPLLRLGRILPPLPHRHVAERVSSRHPELEDRLMNLLDLGHGRASAAPAPLIDGAVQMLHARVEPVPLEDSTSFAPVRRIGRLASVPVAGLLLFVLATPTHFQAASNRLFSPGEHFARPASFTLTVSPQDTSIVRGDTLTISVETIGNQLPRTATIHVSTAQPAVLHGDGGGYFRHELVNVRESFRYRIQAENVFTPWYDVEVMDRPVVRSLQVELTAPAYTGLPRQVLPPGTGDIFALPGTTVQLRIRVGEARAMVVFGSGRQDTLATGGIAEGTFTVNRRDTYSIKLENDAGITNRDPITYQITPLEDLRPTATIREPEPEATLDMDLTAAVLLEIRDDFGFRDLRLWWRLAESRFNPVMDHPQAIALPLGETSTLDQQVPFFWDLGVTTGIDIVPGDVVEYFAEVRDNDAVGGFKAARSATHRLRLPSVTERYDQLSESQLDTENELEALLEESDQIRSEFEAVRDELRRKQQGDWDDARQLEQVADAQRALEQRVEDLASSMEETAADMEDLVSSETLQMFEELRQVTEEINSPDLMEAMEQLQQAIEELNPQKMQEALEKFGFNEEMYRDRLERALELMKNFQVQQKLEEAAERAENMAADQEQLAEQIAEDPEAANQQRDALAEQQLDNKEAMEQLRERMEEIARRMEELQNAPTEDMQELNEDTATQELPEQMQENAAQMQSGQMEQAQRGQQQMQSSLQQLQQSLESMLSGMQSNQQQISFIALQRLLRDVLQLSFDQEALRLEVEKVVGDSPLLRDFAQRQSVLRSGLSTVADSLQSLARQVPQMTRQVQQVTGTALLTMENAVAIMVERNSPAAAREQLAAMTSLNELALLLSDLMDQLMNAPSNNSAGGMSMSEMIQQLQQMAAQQQQLNQQIQEMLGQMQGQRLTPDMQARMQQLAAQQQTLQQQLEELSSHRALARQIAGDLDRIAAQMEETVQQLQSFGTDRELRERQQQILTRLLDASRAMQERGKMRQREGRTGELILRDGPDDPAGTTPEELLRRALLDALEGGYSPDYQELIRRYFGLLQERQ